MIIKKFVVELRSDLMGNIEAQRTVVGPDFLDPNYRKQVAKELYAERDYIDGSYYIVERMIVSDIDVLTPMIDEVVSNYEINFETFA